jgi:hypothetical protein
MGGTSSYPDYLYYSSVEQYDWATDSWSLAEPMLEPRVEHGVAAVPPGRLDRAGGESSGGI